MNVQTLKRCQPIQTDKGDLIKLVGQVENKEFREYLIDQISHSSTQDEVKATSLLIAALVDEMAGQLSS